MRVRVCARLLSACVHALFPHSRMRPSSSLLTAAVSLLGDALLPTKVGGVWRKPALSGRQAAEAAKALKGTEASAAAPPSTR